MSSQRIRELATAGLSPVVLVFALTGCSPITPTDTSDPSDSGTTGGTGVGCSTCGVTDNDGLAEFVWGLDPSNVYCCGLKGICERTADTWCEIMPAGGPNGTFWPNAVWGTSTEDLFAVGSDQDGGGIYHYDGSAWTKVSKTTGVPSLTGIWGSGPTDVFVVGGDDENAGRIIHYNGTEWTYQSNDLYGSFHDVWGTSPSNVWAVGSTLVHAGTDERNEGVLYHFDGSSWQRAASFGGYLSGIWGSSASDVLAVGDTDDGGPLIMHYDGSQWTSMPAPGDEWLLDVYGSGSTHAWAVGWEGTLLHYNGSGWARFASNTEADLRSVWTGRVEDLYICGWELTRTDSSVVKRLLYTP